MGGLILLNERSAAFFAVSGQAYGKLCCPRAGIREIISMMLPYELLLVYRAQNYFNFQNGLCKTEIRLHFHTEFFIVLEFFLYFKEAKQF